MVTNSITDCSAGLERRHLGKRARKDAKHPLLPADPKPESEPESGNEDDTYVNKYIDKNDETGAESVIDGLSDDADGDGEMTEQIPTRLFLETKMPMSLMVGKTMSCR